MREPSLKIGSVVLWSTVVATAYLVSAEVGFSLAFTTKQVTAVWPPTGIAFAALLLLGNRIWPGIFLGALASNALSHEPAWTAAGVAVGNTLGPLIGATLLRRVGFDGSLERIRDVLALVGFGALGTIVTATNGVAQLALAAIVPWHAYGSVWWLWWAGDAIGVILVAPLILTFAYKSTPVKPGASALELAILDVASIGIAWLFFASSSQARLSVYPAIIWSALRFRQRETVIVIAAIAVVAIWGTAHQLGAFGAGSVDRRLVMLMSFLAVLAVTGLVLGAAMAERRAANARLAEAAETLQSAFLPRALPRRTNVVCDGLYVAAGKETLVGGDWYDAFDLPGGQIVVSIGDVVGHGLDAAVAAARIRQGIFAGAFDTGDPAAILQNVNRTSLMQETAIATALVAFLDPTLRVLRYATAGHPTPILAAASQPARMLPLDGGVPLGVEESVGGVTQTARLTPGCVLAFYTDGLIEFDRRMELAERALLDAVGRLAEDPAISRPAAYVQRAVMGARQSPDDVALLVVRVA
ncbi:MAG TPA: MASE1 domain-containing protein [Candidatus Baltobacteraceae bacterium]|nr:MASE1 domain-containing protein [Candidatus Baltobacteraceae bacterium]